MCGGNLWKIISRYRTICRCLRVDIELPKIK
jgi:hypothetical protein